MDFLQWVKDRPLPAALQSRSGWTQLFEHYRTTEPHLHQIEPTNQCNYSCMMCPRHTHMTRKIGFMDMETFKAIIDEVNTYSPETKAKEIELFHFGESLLHPQIVEMVQYTAMAGLKPTLSVNPANLSEDHLNRLLECSSAKLIISLDSLDAESYRTIRGSHADLAKAISKTEALLDCHHRSRSGTDIVIRMIVMHINKHEIDSFRSFWEQRGGKTECRDFFPWSKKELGALGPVQHYPRGMPCPFPWQYMVVQWNGDVVPCCRDYNGVLKLGNIKDTRLQDIWNGENYKNFRQIMAEGNQLPDLCQECLSLYAT